MHGRRALTSRRRKKKAFVRATLKTPLASRGRRQQLLLLLCVRRINSPGGGDPGGRICLKQSAHESGFLCHLDCCCCCACSCCFVLCTAAATSRSTSTTTTTKRLWRGERLKSFLGATRCCAKSHGPEASASHTTQIQGCSLAPRCALLLFSKLETATMTCICNREGLRRPQSGDDGSQPRRQKTPREEASVSHALSCVMILVRQRNASYALGAALNELECARFFLRNRPAGPTSVGRQAREAKCAENCSCCANTAASELLRGCCGHWSGHRQSDTGQPTLAYKTVRK